MDDLRQRFAILDHVAVPDVWSEVERRVEAHDAASPRSRVVADRPIWRDGGNARAPQPSVAPRGRHWIALLVAAMLIAVALVGGFLAVGTGLIRLDSVVPPGPDATPIVPASPIPSIAPTPSAGAAAPSPSSNPAKARPGIFAQLLDWDLVSDTVGWGVTGSSVLRTSDRGATWADVPPGLTAISVAAFVDAETAYVAASGSPITIAATHDGGASWVRVPVDIGALNGGPVLSFQTPTHGYATFFDPDGANRLAVFATVDGGLTWSGPRDGAVPHMAGARDKLTDPLGGFFHQRAGKFDNQPFDNSFFLSADGGASWTASRFPTGPRAPKDELKEIVDIVQDIGGPFRMAIMVNGGDPAVYESTDDPATWRLVRTLPGPDVQLLSSTTWVVVTSRSEFRSTTDAGAHWRTTVTPTEFRERPRFATPDTAWVTVSCSPDPHLPPDPHCDGTTTQGMVLVTSDGGATWTRIDR